MSHKTRIIVTIVCLFALLSCASAVDYEGHFSGFVKNRTLLDDWYGVYFSETKVGWEHIDVAEGTLDGKDVIRVGDDGVVLYRMEDEKTPMKNTFSGEVFLTPGDRLLGFRYTQALLSHELVVVGEAKGGVVYVDITSGGGTQRIKFNESENIIPSSALAYLTLKEKISPGKTYAYRVFLESLRLTEDIKVTVKGQEDVIVNGKKEKAYRVEGAIRGYTVTSFVQADGRVIKQITMDNFVAVRQPEREATNLGADSGLTLLAIIDFSLIRPNRPIADPEGLSFLSVKIENIPAGTLPLPSDFQQITGPDQEKVYTYTIAKAEPSSLSVPAYGGFPKEVANYLEPSLEIESTHKKITDAAKKIIGEKTDPLTDARKITTWVFKNVAKKMVDTTSALDTLRSMEGECQAHAHLLAALLRADGIPAKVVSGVVYSPDIGGFLYHSWDEVYLGRWVPVDAAFGQFPADVTHIKFSEGGPESVIDTIPLVGLIKIEVVETKKD